MTVSEELLHYWSKKLITNIANKAIDILKKETNVLYEEADCLENNWEVYCIEVQSGDFPDRVVEIYMHHIENIFGRLYQEISKEEKYTLWLESEEGQEWYWDDNNRENENIDLLDDPCFIVNYQNLLMNEIHNIAEKYECPNIIKYIDYECMEEEYE